MQLSTVQKKAIDHHYKELAAYQAHNVSHETALRSAFQNLLAVFAQSANWTLIPEQTIPNGKRSDGTLRDSFNLPRGYWEGCHTDCWVFRHFGDSGIAEVCHRVGKELLVRRTLSPLSCG